MQSCRDDRLNGPRGVVNAEEQVAVARKAYALLGAQDSILHEICPGTHQWHEEHLAENLAFLFKHSKA